MQKVDAISDSGGSEFAKGQRQKNHVTHLHKKKKKTFHTRCVLAASSTSELRIAAKILFLPPAALWASS